MAIPMRAIIHENGKLSMSVTIHGILVDLTTVPSSLEWP